MSAYLDAFHRETDGLKHLAVSLVGDCESCRFPYSTDPEDFKRRVEAGELNDEGGFSWSSCDACGSHLGGQRYSAHAFTEKGERLHLEVCEDCLVFIANGDEPASWEP